MKRKPKAVTPVVPGDSPDEVLAPEVVVREITQGSGRSLGPDQVKPSVRCIVCGADANPDAVEQLCWVCRRLKISAWRDVEQQMPAQE